MAWLSKPRVMFSSPHGIESVVLCHLQQADIIVEKGIQSFRRTPEIKR